MWFLTNEQQQTHHSKNYQNDNGCLCVCLLMQPLPCFQGPLLVVKVVMFHKKLFAKSKNCRHSVFWCDACRKLSDKLESQQGQCFQTHFLLFWWKIADIPHLRLIDWLILSTICVTLRISCHEKMHCALRIRNGYQGKTAYL